MQVVLQFGPEKGKTVEMPLHRAAPMLRDGRVKPLAGLAVAFFPRAVREALPADYEPENETKTTGEASAAAERPPSTEPAGRNGPPGFRPAPPAGPAKKRKGGGSA